MNGNTKQMVMGDDVIAGVVSKSDEEADEAEIEASPGTSSSMSNLLEGMSCEAPYEQIIVDMRDSLFIMLHANDTDERGDNIEEFASRVVFWAINGCEHMLEIVNGSLSAKPVGHCEAMRLQSTLLALSSHTLMFGENGTIVLGRGEESDNEREDTAELVRWMAPELIGYDGLRKKDAKATAQTIAYSAGVLLMECITAEVPFKMFEAADLARHIANGTANNMIINKLRGRTQLSGFIERCLTTIPTGRPSLKIIKRTVLGLLPDTSRELTKSDMIDLTAASYSSGDDDDDNSWRDTTMGSDDILTQTQTKSASVRTKNRG
jgi:hypothetical protein